MLSTKCKYPLSLVCLSMRKFVTRVGVEPTTSSDPKSDGFASLPTKVFYRMCGHLSVGSSLSISICGCNTFGRGSTLKYLYSESVILIPKNTKTIAKHIKLAIIITLL